MINDLTTNINTYNNKVINNYEIFMYHCPKCGAKHCFIRHGFYERYVCFFNDKFEICEEKITILRLLCKSCKSTHAILPGNVIPYTIYDNFCILHILTLHFVLKQSVLSISQKYRLSFQLIYQFISKFTRFLSSLFFVLKALIGFEGDISDTSGMLQAINQFTGNFSYQYFFYTKWLFLMTKFQYILPGTIYIGMHFKPPT